MNRSTKSIVAAAALLGGAARLPLANADAGRGPKRVHLVLTETGTAFHFIDAPAAQEDGRAGDAILFESDLSSGGETVGSLEGHCVQVRADGSLAACAAACSSGFAFTM